MKEYKIESNVEIPNNIRGKKKYNFPFSEMSVGESFFISGIGRTGEIAAAKRQMSLIKNKSEVEFTSKTYPDGLRIWRIK